MDASRDHVAGKIERFIIEEFQVPPDDPRFTRDVHLFEDGYVSSMGFVQLMAFLEEAFDVKVDEMQLFGDEFTTIHGIADVVAQTLGAKDAGPEALERLPAPAL